VAWVLGVSMLRVGLIPPEQCPPVTVALVEAAIEGAGDWAVDNLRSDGRFLYRHDRVADPLLASPISLGYNLPRHAGMTNALYQAVVSGFDHYLPGADVSLNYMLDNLVEHDDWVAFASQDRPVKIGSTGLFVASLVHRRIATGDTIHDDLIQAGARFLASQQEPNGALLAFWDRGSSSPVPDTYGAFGTGEAMWALALAGQVFPDDGFTEAARRTGAYIASDRRENEGLILRIPDHWAAYAFDALGGPETEIEREYLRRMAGDFALMTRVESTRSASGLQAQLRWGHALGAGVGALGEGLGGLERLSRIDTTLGVDADALAEHLACAGGILVDRQVTEEEAGAYAHPMMVRGAWFKNEATQVDDQQHTLSALLALRDVLTLAGGG
jgi:hypothetical protein